MAKLEKILNDVEKELKEKKENIREEMQEELGVEEGLVREAAEQGHPGNTAENMNDLEKIGKEQRSLKAVKEALQEMKISEIEEKIQGIKEERQETDRNGSEQIMYGYSAAIQSLEEAEKLLKGKEYKAQGLGRSAATTFPDPQKKIEDQLSTENELLRDFRENNVHLLLRSAKTLDEANPEKHLENKEILKEELRKRAEDLDYLIINASIQLEEARKKNNS